MHSGEDGNMTFGILTLNPLQLGAPKGHGQVERDEVLMVAHCHQEIKFHLSQHLSQRGTREYHVKGLPEMVRILHT